jgi:hypothetical protein
MKIRVFCARHPINLLKIIGNRETATKGRDILVVPCKECLSESRQVGERSEHEFPRGEGG